MSLTIDHSPKMSPSNVPPGTFLGHINGKDYYYDPPHFRISTGVYTYGFTFTELERYIKSYSALTSRDYNELKRLFEWVQTDHWERWYATKTK